MGGGRRKGSCPAGMVKGVILEHAGKCEWNTGLFP